MSRLQVHYRSLLVILIAHILVVAGLQFLSFKDLPLILAAHYLFAIFGASFGLHKFISHRLFKIENPLFLHFILLISTLTLQGPLLQWALNHRVHHLHTNTDLDPHSAKKGFFWSHIGWLIFKSEANSSSFKHSLVRDLKDIPTIRFYSRYYYLINFLFYALLAAVCLTTQNLALFFIFGPLRTVTVWHSTWLVNSASHNATLFGTSSGEPGKSWLVSFLIPGEGDHAYHHQNPHSLWNKKDWSLSNSFYRFILKGLQILKMIRFKVSTH